MPASTPTLRDMVEDARNRGLTYRQLAERAVDPETGQTASLSLFNDIARGKVDRMPYEYHLRAIATALGKPYPAVFQAALRQWFPGATAQSTDSGTSALLAEARQLMETARQLTEAAERQQAGESGGERESA